MAGKRIQRVNELLQREIASGLYRLQTTPPLDTARVTISAVDTTPDLKKTTVMVSVLAGGDGDTTAGQVVRTLNRHRKEFQQLISSNIVLKYTPHLQFVEDRGQEHADRIYQILDNLPPMAEEPPASEEDSSNGTAT
jgi:ribosome-binding factor A